MTNITDARYTWYQHKRSGEVYAVEFDHAQDDRFTRVAGPLHHSEPRDPQSIKNYLNNQDAEDMERDASWLMAEIEHGA